MKRTRVLVLGGGAGGLELACQLGGRKDLEVVLVDRVPTHVWKPRLHEMAAGTVATSLSEISFYLLAAARGFQFSQGAVEAIDPAGKTVRLAAIADPDGRTLAPERSLAYDLCVVALGGVTPDFGTAGVEDHAIRLDGIDDADAFRDRFVPLIIGARETGTPVEVAIVGSGPTGTELAAHLRLTERGFFETGLEKGRDSLLSVTLIDSGPEVMSGVDDALRREIVQRLRSLDIHIVTDAEISEVTDKDVRTKTGESWRSDLTVWAVGTVANPVLKMLGCFELDRKGRIAVDAFLRSTVNADIYAIGDACAFTPHGAERALPPTAQVASQQAVYLAAALPARAAGGGEPKPFAHEDKGTLVSLASAGTVGRLSLRKHEGFSIGGGVALAAYHALERQHQWRVLGKVRGTAAIVADLLSPAKGPALKLYGE